MAALRLAVFDCDGTLVDSHHAIGAVMAEAFAAHGIAPPDARAMMEVVGLQLTAAIAELVPEASAEVHDRLTDDYRRIAGEHRESGQWREALFPGVAESLRALDAAGWLLGVATGKSLRGLRQTLETHGLGELFVTLQTPDAAPGKPDPTMLLQAMREAGVDAASVAMIGDTTYDMEMADAAGVVAVGVAWGYHAPERLIDAGAARVVEEFADVPAVLDEVVG